MKYTFALVMVLVAGMGMGWWFAEKNTKDTDVPTTTQSQPGAPNEEVSDVEVSDFLPSRTVVVYDGVTVSAGLRELSLTNRGLTGSLKAEVRLLTELEVLDISGNRMTGLPAEVGQLQNLRVLNLANNQFTGLPLELGNLQNLEVLDVRGNANIAEVDLAQIIDRLPATVEVLR